MYTERRTGEYNLKQLWELGGCNETTANQPQSTVEWPWDTHNLQLTNESKSCDHDTGET